MQYKVLYIEQNLISQKKSHRLKKNFRIKYD